MKLKTLFLLAAVIVMMAGCASIDISSRSAGFAEPVATWPLNL